MRLKPPCAFSQCPNRAAALCDCSWLELHRWPVGELAKLLEQNSALFPQAVSDAATGQLDRDDHGLTLMALEDLLTKDLGADDIRTEIRAIIESAATVLRRGQAISPSQPHTETANAPEYR